MSRSRFVLVYGVLFNGTLTGVLFSLWMAFTTDHTFWQELLFMPIWWICGAIWGLLMSGLFLRRWNRRAES